MELRDSDTDWGPALGLGTGISTKERVIGLVVRDMGLGTGIWVEDRDTGQGDRGHAAGTQVAVGPGYKGSVGLGHSSCGAGCRGTRGLKYQGQTGRLWKVDERQPGLSMGPGRGYLWELFKEGLFIIISYLSYGGSVQERGSAGLRTSCRAEGILQG